VQASLGELALWQGHPEDAARQLADALATIDFSPEVRIGELYALGLRACADAAEVSRARRMPDREREATATGGRLLDAIRRRHEGVTTTRPILEPLSRAWVLLCEAESTRLRRSPDPEAWVASVAAWDALGRPYPAAYARWREAEARLATRGDRDLAAAALRAARDTAVRLAAEPLAREVTSLAARARLSLDDAPDEAPAPADGLERLGLTAREREVLGLVALGRTNRQIADELFISENTAGVHVSRILGKLGVGGRGEAAALAYRLGLVAPLSDASAHAASEPA
jgi:DNA-binding CsgD family transcriptional regulator